MIVGYPFSIARHVLAQLPDPSRIDTRALAYRKNVANLWNGELIPAKGHDGRCRWRFDGQFYIHYHEDKE